MVFGLRVEVLTVVRHDLGVKSSSRRVGTNWHFTLRAFSIHYLLMLDLILWELLIIIVQILIIVIHFSNPYKIYAHRLVLISLENFLLCLILVGNFDASRRHVLELVVILIWVLLTKSVGFVVHWLVVGYEQWFGGSWLRRGHSCDRILSLFSHHLVHLLWIFISVS